MSKQTAREIGNYLAQFLDGLAAPLTYEQVDEISTCLADARTTLDYRDDESKPPAVVTFDLGRSAQRELVDCLDLCLTAYEAVYWRTVAVELILTGAEPWHVPSAETRGHIALMLLGGHVRFERSVVDDEIRRRRSTEKGHTE